MDAGYAKRRTLTQEIGAKQKTIWLRLGKVTVAHTVLGFKSFLPNLKNTECLNVNIKKFNHPLGRVVIEGIRWNLVVYLISRRQDCRLVLLVYSL